MVPLSKEYTLNYIGNPNKIEGLFLNEGMLESLGRFTLQLRGIFVQRKKHKGSSMEAIITSDPTAGR